MNPDPLSCDEIEAMWLSDLGSFGCIPHGENITQLGLVSDETSAHIHT